MSAEEDGEDSDVVSVILGGFGTRTTSAGETDMSIYEGEHTEINVAQCVDQLKESSSVIIVPGYGLAVAKAQYAISDVNGAASLEPARLECLALSCARLAMRH